LKERPKLGLKLEVLPAGIALHERLNLGNASSLQNSRVRFLGPQFAGAEMKKRFVEGEQVIFSVRGAL